MKGKKEGALVAAATKEGQSRQAFARLLHGVAGAGPTQESDLSTARGWPHIFMSGRDHHSAPRRIRQGPAVAGCKLTTSPERDISAPTRR